VSLSHRQLQIVNSGGVEVVRNNGLAGAQSIASRRRQVGCAICSAAATVDRYTSLVRKGMTESAACIHIAKNPRKFHQKYPTNSRTVHREFLRAKRLDFIPF